MQLLDAYAKDPAGGGEALSVFAKENLVNALAARPQAFSVLAFAGSGFMTASVLPAINWTRRWGRRSFSKSCWTEDEDIAMNAGLVLVVLKCIAIKIRA